MRWQKGRRLVIELSLALVLSIVLSLITKVPFVSASHSAPVSAARLVITAETTTAPWEISIGEDGSWSLANGSISFTSEEVAAASQWAGLDINQILNPQDVAWWAKTFKEMDIQSLAWAKNGQDSTFFVNGVPANLNIHDAATEGVGKLVPPALKKILDWVTQSTSLQLVFLFPPASSNVYPLDFNREIDTTISSATIINHVSLSATISPDGNLVSAGGMSIQNGPNLLSYLGLDRSVVDQLGLHDAELTFGGRSIALSANNEPWVSLTWDSSLPKVLWGKGYTLMGVVFTPEDQNWASVAQNTIASSEVSFHLYVSDSPMDKAPVIDLGQPLVLSVGSESLRANSIELSPYLGDLGFSQTDIANMRDYLKTNGDMMATWDGASSQLRWGSTNQTMPSIQVDKGFVTTLGNSLDPQSTILPQGVSWNEVEYLLANTSLKLAVVSEGTIPDFTTLAANTAPVQPMVVIPANITLSRRGQLAIESETLPLDFIGSMAGMDLSGMLRDFLANVPDGITTANLKLGPSGISLGIQGKEIHLLWDEESRANLVRTVLKNGFPDIQEGSLPSWAIEQGIAAINQAQINVSVTLNNEELPPGTAQQVLSWFGQ